MPSYKIIMSGEIGWDILPSQIREQLDGITTDLEVDLSSPGGGIFEGIEIKSLFEDHKRNFPKSQMMINVMGLAASMASDIAVSSAFDLVTVREDSSFMIHNPINTARGDYREMLKMADFLKGLRDVVSLVYIERSKKSQQEIDKIMNDETWLFGQEIIAAGFADEIIKVDTPIERNPALVAAEMKYKKLRMKLDNQKPEPEKFTKVAAILKNYVPGMEFNPSQQPEQKIESNNNKNPAVGGNNNNKENIKMDIKEFEKEHPGLHAEAEKIGSEKGQKDERERSNKLMEMKEQPEYKNLPAVQARIDEAVKKGESMQDCQMACMAILAQGGSLAQLDSAEHIDTGEGSGTASGEQGSPDMKEKEAANRRW